MEVYLIAVVVLNNICESTKNDLEQQQDAMTVLF